jgi:branched-chain amino acid transport system permease protein
MLAAGLAAAVVAGLLGLVFERLVVRPVYGQHLKQILVTMGGFIVVEQGLIAIWGASPIALPRPPAWRGAIQLGDAAVEKYRLLAVGLGLVVLLGLQLVLRGTRLGLLIRAGVEDREMVEALGYRIRRVFVLVFVAGSALAGLGGVLWAFYQETVSAALGMQLMVLIFIVIIIGGLGSVGGCLIGAVLVGLVANYAAFLTPKLALASNVLLMAAVLAWRPEGLFPVTRR